MDSFSLTGDAAEYRDVLRLVIELKKIENIENVWIQNITNIENIDTESIIIRYTINAYWNMDPFLEGIEKKSETQEEDILDSELDQLES